MAYIGTGPENKGTGLFSQDTFTGDGSTTTFDLTNAVPDGGGNDIQVFVDNVRQQEGSSNAYTVGFDGSSVFKRITFTSAPASGQSIFVLNPGTKNVQQVTTVSDNVVTTAKVQDLAISTAKIAGDAINATKLADDAVSEEHLDVTSITGHSELAEVAANDDVILVFDTSAGTLKKIQRSNLVLQAPTFSSVSPTSANATGNTTLTITGTGFVSGTTASLISNTGVAVNFDSVTRDSSTQLTAVVDGANLVNAQEPYDIKITSGNGLATTSDNQLNVNAAPVYTTAAGTLGSARINMSGVEVNATDPESAGNVTFELQSGALPPGISITNTGANGGTATFTGNFSSLASSDTTFNFVLRAVDAASNTNSRSFSFTQSGPSTTSFTSSGTFAVPTGISSADVLVVAGGASGGTHHGGGGGAGGLVFMPGVTLNPGGTVAITVGCGGAAIPQSNPTNAKGNAGQDSVFGASPSPGAPQGALTSKGGGGGGYWGCTGGNPGGSGGGSGANNGTGGSATQPTQPGNSGAYGFGNSGGNGQSAPGGGGGGGGAGAGGNPAAPGNPGDQKRYGGIGKAYTIADGTTPVYYAGGGGGGSHEEDSPTLGLGGQGGGGAGGFQCNPGLRDGVAGQANKGGGGGGAGSCVSQASSGGGGKGIVIVRY